MEKKGSLFLQSLRVFLWMTLLTGLVYPLFITAVAQLTMKRKADGSFVSYNGKLVGSSLIGQKFQGDKYFWPRPSSIDYNALTSGGSNLGPTSAELKKAVDERKSRISKGQEKADAALIPEELLFASGSGLDPHISPKTAYFQVDRIVKARGLQHESGTKTINELIEKFTESRHIKFLGYPYVNVLLLNIALDEIQANK